MKYFLFIVWLVGCSLVESKASLNFQVDSGYAYFYNTRSGGEEYHHWHFTDTAVIQDGFPHQVEKVVIKRKGVYGITATTAYYELDLIENEISTFNRKPRDGTTHFKTFTNLRYYDKRKMEQAYRLH